MNIFNAFLLFILSVCVHRSFSQVLQFGFCPEVDTVKFFDLERFLGKWYEIQRFPTWYERYGQCSYKRIKSCGRHIQIEHGFVRDHIEYVLHVNSTYSPGDEAIFVFTENSVDPIAIPLSVIATNYENYAVVYGCTHSEHLNIKYVSAWILSREANLSSEHIQSAYDIINGIPTLSAVYMETVHHEESNCDHYWTAHVQAENVTATNDATLLGYMGKYN